MCWRLVRSLWACNGWLRPVCYACSRQHDHLEHDHLAVTAPVSCSHSPCHHAHKQPEKNTQAFTHLRTYARSLSHTYIHTPKHTYTHTHNTHATHNTRTTRTQHTTHNTQHTTHNTQHTTHNTQHTTHTSQSLCVSISLSLNTQFLQLQNS